jgi:nucleoid DNA-binding protein
MKRQDISKAIARQTHSSTARTADEVDRVVTEVIRKIRRGQKAQLPGLGSIDATARRDASGPRE